MRKQKVAGVQITSMLELKQYCIPLALPETYDTLRLLNVVTPVRPAHARIDTARRRVERRRGSRVWWGCCWRRGWALGASTTSTTTP